uniref:Vitellogenin n=1 Tax=Panagrolaimus sp. ES5 TaxID=591445 RepID=A0AC34GHJ7_9BILA
MGAYFFEFINCVGFYREYRPCRAILNGELRIRYEHFSYHSECFASMGKVNVDGKDIPNYDTLDEPNKLILNEHFVISDDFDIPLVENAKKLGYCNADKCSASQTPSKFPFPYTITYDQLLIGYKGDSFHPSCFQASCKVNVDAK